MSLGRVQMIMFLFFSLSSPFYLIVKRYVQTHFVRLSVILVRFKAKEHLVLFDVLREKWTPEALGWEMGDYNKMLICEVLQMNRRMGVYNLY